MFYLSQGQGRHVVGLYIDQRYDKSHRRRSLRGTTCTPSAWVGCPSPALLAVLEEGDKETFPFLGVSADVLNRALKKSCRGLGVSPITTYTIRRWFVNVVLDRTDGDFELARKYTNHFSINVMKAHYEQWIGTRTFNG